MLLFCLFKTYEKQKNRRRKAKETVSIVHRVEHYQQREKTFSTKDADSGCVLQKVLIEE